MKVVQLDTACEGEVDGPGLHHRSRELFGFASAVLGRTSALSRGWAFRGASRVWLRCERITARVPRCCGPEFGGPISAPRRSTALGAQVSPVLESSNFEPGFAILRSRGCFPEPVAPAPGSGLKPGLGGKILRPGGEPGTRVGPEEMRKGRGACGGAAESFRVSKALRALSAWRLSCCDPGQGEIT